MDEYRTNLDAAFVRSVLDYDPDTGSFTWRHRSDRPRKWNTRYADKPAGYISRGYRVIQISGPAGYRANRLAWLIMHGVWPEHQLDHINGIRSDDRIGNLREATNAENNSNRSKQSNNTSGFRGVSWHNQNRKWRARMKINGKFISLGLYDSAADAGAAYREAEIKLRNGFYRP